MSADRLCFGTSTFAAGHLLPDKDSRPGVEALALACRAGVSNVHSNPMLGTQWAIREAVQLADYPPLRHLIKVEAPLDAGRAAWAARIEEAVHTSCETLGVARVNTVVWELDLKRTRDLSLLAAADAVREFVTIGSVLARNTGRVDSVVAYSHSPRHLLAATVVDGIDGIAAQYNIAEPWPALYLNRLRQAGLDFLGMSPLRRGLLVTDRDLDAAQQAAPAALQWALGDPRVTATVITMSTTDHVKAALAAASSPLSAESPQATAQQWFRRLDGGRNPQEGACATRIHSQFVEDQPERPQRD
ncbi:MAG: hypothetical protein ACRDTA_27110 [Pseudonocardiaceae bacterium]